MDIEFSQNPNEDTMIADEVVDWRGRTCTNKHGGMRAAIFVLGLQAFEMMAVAAVGNNLITYVLNDLYFPLPKSANIVTNFIGTVFLLSLVGGFLSDSYLGSWWTMLVFGLVELSGFTILSIQAHLPQLRPPKCNMMAGRACAEAKGFKAAVFFTALYLVALGSGCMKPNIVSHGADQFRKDDANQSKKLSTYFNTAYFSFCVGELMALTVLVWVQTQCGMDIGFGISAAVMGAGLISLACGTFYYRNKSPRGSIFAPVAKIFVAKVSKKKQIRPSNADTVKGRKKETELIPSTTNNELITSNDNLFNTRFRFLDKACIQVSDGSGEHCNAMQVEQVKIVLSVIPIFACTIVFNTVLAQLQTFSVQQGSTMDTQLARTFMIPPASLQSIPYVMLMVLVPLYEIAFVPLTRKITGKESGISPLQRIGVGLFTVTFSMISAAIVERKRRELAINTGKRLSIFWIAPQFLVFGLSEMFTAVGLIEFFYKQSLAGMQSSLTAMTYCSYSFGFYFSSVLVSMVNSITSQGKARHGWLSDNDLNKDRLDLFYWLLAMLSLLNFFNYLFWSRWYTCNPSRVFKSTNTKVQGKQAYNKEDNHQNVGLE